MPIANNTVNAVAMAVLPDAPTDVVTGLKVPTIAVATAEGVSVIKHDGTVVKSGNYGNIVSVAFTTKGGICIPQNSMGSYHFYPSEPVPLLTNGFGWGILRYDFLGYTALPVYPVEKAVRTNRETLLKSIYYYPGGISRIIDTSWSTPLKGRQLIGDLTSSFNNGYLVGDIRRCYLADTVVGSVSNPATVADRSYKAATTTVYGTITKSLTASANQLVAYSGFSAANYLREPYSADLNFGTGEWSVGAWVNYTTAVASIIASRAYSSGASIVLGTDATGKLTATAYDGTTTRTVTTTNSHNTATWLKAVAHYRAGRLSIEVNGVEVASTGGAPLLTLNNTSAVLTIGNSYALDAPFPGSIALLKLGATVPSPEQSLWMYEQEKSMFRDGAQVTLPSSGSVVDLTYDEAQDKWVAVQATHESSWTGLVRTGVTTPSAGSFSKVAATSGVKLLARTTTTPGVDVTIPALGLKEELVRRAEAAAAQSRQLQVFDFDTVGFTAAMTSGSPTVTASSIVGTPYVGMGVTGTGVPANTTIIGINGTTYTLSANCTATASNAVAQSTFTLTPGWTATEVIAASASKREGSTKDWVRLYDGFLETVRFAVSPGSAAWVQITARKDT